MNKKEQILELIETAKNRYKRVKNSQIDSVECSICNNDCKNCVVGSCQSGSWYYKYFSLRKRYNSYGEYIRYGHYESELDYENCKNELLNLLLDRRAYWMSELEKMNKINYEILSGYTCITGMEYTKPKKPKVRTIRDLKKEDDYWYINHYGTSVETGHYDCGDSGLDSKIRNSGNAFLTEEEAEKELKFRKLRRNLQIEAKIAWDGEEIDWSKNNEQKKYNFYIDMIIESIGNNNCVKYRWECDVVFPTKESLKQAIEINRGLFDEVYDTKGFAINW